MCALLKDILEMATNKNFPFSTFLSCKTTPMVRFTPKKLPIFFILNFDFKPPKHKYMTTEDILLSFFMVINNENLFYGDLKFRSLLPHFSI